MRTSFALTAVAGAGLAAAAATPVRMGARADTTSSGSLPIVTVKGNAFFAGDERFYIRGVDYQPGGSSDAADPIANVETCKRDVVEFQKLGINTVRVYTIDNTANHDECMAALAAAGIYLALDVNTPKYSINRNNPKDSYNSAYLQSLFATIDAFAGYSNTLLFFSGNEVINSDNTTTCAPYVKAVTRDMRQYLTAQGHRQIPVGYSAADVSSNRLEMAQYMNCGTDDQRSDFFAFNDYSWCDPSSFSTSGWDQKVKSFTGYSIPLFLSEYGCNANTRKFEEVATLYSSQMSSVYSGGLVYEYMEEGNQYGLVSVSGSDITEGPDFTALQSAFAATAQMTGDGGYSSSGSASTCPDTSSTWQVTDFKGSDLPGIPTKAAAFMTSGAGKGPGLNGPGSQDTGDESTGTAPAGSAMSTYADSTNNNAGNGTSTSTTTTSSTPKKGAAPAGLLAAAGYAPLACAVGASLLAALVL